MRFFSNFRFFARIQHYKDVLGKDIHNKDVKDMNLEFLLKECVKEKGLSEIINENNINLDELKKLYYKILENGGNRHVRTHWVAASAFCYEDTLNYILSNKDNINLSSVGKLIERFSRMSGRI